MPGYETESDSVPAAWEMGQEEGRDAERGGRRKGKTTNQRNGEKKNEGTENKGM